MQGRASQLATVPRRDITKYWQWSVLVRAVAPREGETVITAYFKRVSRDGGQKCAMLRGRLSRYSAAWQHDHSITAPVCHGHSIAIASQPPAPVRVENDRPLDWPG